MTVSIKRLGAGESTFLDLARGLAAMIVFLGHFRPYGYAMPIPGEIAHDAVVVFFVLSGYLIAYSTFRKPIHWRDYLIARVSRLYSVIVPALILTGILAAVGFYVRTDFYQSVDKGHDVLRLVLTFLCLQETWWLNASPPTNQPFWSLAYEFWYYVVFALGVFIRGLKFKILAIGVVLALLGPKIILLFPVWLFGAFACLLSDKIKVGSSLAKASFACVLPLWVLGIIYLPRLPHDVAPPPLFNSSAFLSDSISGFLFAALIVSFHLGFSRWNPPERLQGGIKWFADRTFSLYLMHLPLIFFFTAIFNPDRRSPVSMGVMVAAILAIVFVISEFTELRRPVIAKYLGRFVHAK